MIGKICIAGLPSCGMATGQTALGLTLQSTKGQVQTLLIDRIEKPSQN